MAMKKNIFILMAFLLTTVVGNAQNWSSYRGKTLYLASYGAFDEVKKVCPHPFVCRFGEYMNLGTNGVLTWNSRAGGKNSSYTYRVDGKKLILTPKSGAYDPNDKYIEIISANGDRLMTRSNNGVYRILSTQRQTVYTKAAAEITKFWMEAEQTRNGEKGIIVHVDAQFFHVSRHDLRVSAYFEVPVNRGIKDTNGRYRGYNGTVCTESNITNNGDDTNIIDLKLFIPYSELELKGESRLKGACQVIIHDKTLGGADYSLAKSDKLGFTYDPRTKKAVISPGSGGGIALLWLFPLFQ
jgi:hypothetical protein